MKLGTKGAERRQNLREHLRCFRRKHDFVSIRLGPVEFKIRCLEYFLIHFVIKSGLYEQLL
ncbi:hypothetical protein GCM10008933_36270 [Paenibacillus motobuensis]|uniref:Uncharacterized protein n=1 Tax=Paenibacillus motobuensis TaxID=295324 RepID=A0ABP3IGK8_9BACL